MRPTHVTGNRIKRKGRKWQCRISTVLRMQPGTSSMYLGYYLVLGVFSIYNKIIVYIFIAHSFDTSYEYSSTRHNKSECAAAAV